MSTNLSKSSKSNRYFFIPANFHRTPEPEKNDDEKRILAKRKIIDAEFRIPKIEIAVSSKEEKKIIVLHIEGLGVQFVQKTYGMNANLSLHSLVIEDCIQQHGPEFKYLATSNKGGESSDLISIKYLMTAKVMAKRKILRNF